MKKFSEFGIKPQLQNFTGEKIKISRILNKEITIHNYRIEDSQYGSNKKCLHLQIELEGKKRVVFTGSVTLMNMIQEVPKDGGFPFDTTIIENDERYEFT